jgi:N-formylglutamate amidohydrolase
MDSLEVGLDGEPQTLYAAGEPFARIVPASSPVVAVALHAGHTVRSELEPLLAISAEDRLREEDPWTAQMAPHSVTRIEVLRSRYEIDLNRPRFRAVYQGPEDAWGLRLYTDDLPDREDRVSRDIHDAFYAQAHAILSHVERTFGSFVVLDIHSYNHRRDGIDGPSAPTSENPEVNLGTGRMDRERWAPVVEGFSAVMNDAGFDCRENVKFRGGHFARWVAETFPHTGAALAIEFKKTYMDEWSGAVDEAAVQRIRSALAATVPAITAALGRRA